MFGGIVETTGTITNIQTADGCQHMTIKPDIAFDDVVIGESIAINGVCLTVTALTKDTFNVTAVPETLRLTNLSRFTTGSLVNLERSLKMNARIGGHQVQGHVDGVGEVLEIKKDGGEAWLVKISIPTALSRYIVPKGYITLDGMSITIIETSSEWFTVTFIPHTQAVTTVKDYKVGTLINIEVDITGKYIEKFLGAYQHANSQ